MLFQNFKIEFWKTIRMIQSNMEKLIEPVIHSEGLTKLQVYILFAVKEERISTAGGLEC